MSFFTELKRRNVFRVAAAYIVAAWLVVEATSLILDIYSAPVWIVKVLIALLVLAFPITLLFSWVYELTPEGLKKESEIEHSASIAAATGKRLDIITIALLIGVAGFVLFDRFDRNRSTEATVASEPASSGGPEAIGAAGANNGSDSGQFDARASIAVLPFADMSPQKDQEYFSDGMSEELLHLLAKIPELKVAARTSSFQFKGDNRDISEVARMLGVNHVLEGSVRKAGERIRVTAQLIDARDGFHLWSETYDRDLKDILAVQDEISSEIVSALSKHLGVAVTAGTTGGRRQSNPEAYDLYLRGNFSKQRRTPDSLLEAVRHYQQAVALDPGLAPAWGGLARAADLVGETNPVRESEFFAIRDNAVQHALALDADQPQALATLSGHLFQVENNYAGALEALERVIAADPSDTEAMSWLAQRYRAVGMLEKAEAMNRRAYSIDSLSPRVILGMTRILGATGKHAEARRVAEKALRELNDHPYAALALTEYHAISGDLEGADSTLAKLPQTNPIFVHHRIQVLVLMNRPDEARAVSQAFIDKVPEGHFGRSLMAAMTDYMLGNPESALELFKEAHERGFNAVVFWFFRPGTRQHFAEDVRHVWPDFSPWIADFPEVIRGYTTLGVDIVAELKAAGVIAQ